jgi:hypothetical protein
MRSRKPWVFARRRLFGWNVRLLTRGLQEGNSASGQRVNGRKGGWVPQGHHGFYEESEGSLGNQRVTRTSYGTGRLLTRSNPLGCPVARGWCGSCPVGTHPGVRLPARFVRLWRTP